MSVSTNDQVKWWREAVYYIFIHPAGVVGAFVASILIGALLTPVLGGPIADRIFVHSPPIYPVQIAFGFTTGLLLNRLLRSRSALLVWILGATLLYWGSSAAVHGGLRLYDYLLGRGIAARSDQLFSIAPFEISVAYSAGALLGLKWAARSQRLADLAERATASGPINEGLR
jgi:hypothetical protein